MRKFGLLALIIGGLALSQGGEVSALSQSDIHLSSRVIHQGELSLIRIHVEKGETPLVTWMGKEVYLVSNPEKTDWIGFLGVDLTAVPKQHDVVVKVPGSGPEQRLNIEVRKKDYGVRNLTLPQHMVDLDAETAIQGTVGVVPHECKIVHVFVARPKIGQTGGNNLAVVLDHDGMGTVVGVRTDIRNHDPAGAEREVQVPGREQCPVFEPFKVSEAGRLSLAGRATVDSDRPREGDGGPAPGSARVPGQSPGRQQLRVGGRERGWRRRDRRHAGRVMWSNSAIHSNTLDK